MPRVPQVSPARAKNDGHARWPCFEGGARSNRVGRGGEEPPRKRKNPKKEGEKNKGGRHPKQTKKGKKSRQEGTSKRAAKERQGKR